jgi:hypothetical protein
MAARRKASPARLQDGLTWKKPRPGAARPASHKRKGLRGKRKGMTSEASNPATSEASNPFFPIFAP